MLIYDYDCVMVENIMFIDGQYTNNKDWPPL